MIYIRAGGNRAVAACDFAQKFWSSFFKSLRGGWCVALLAACGQRNILFGVSFLITFFFAPLASKKKVADKFSYFKRLFVDKKNQIIIQQ
ncbi:MAG: hypothetical protein IJX80_10915 [Clostridia bacterium]|nr:hypothetical protein [Clostridia bacterium]